MSDSHKVNVSVVILDDCIYNISVKLRSFTEHREEEVR